MSDNIMNYYNNFEDAYINVLKDLKNEGLISYPRGKKTKELLGYSFTLNNPRNRLINIKSRKLNVFYLIGNLFWVLQQSNKLDFIKYYNDKGINFSDDGEVLRGAYGKRIFDIDGVNQWYQCIKELKLDKHSRRAIITFHLPQYDWAGSL